MRADAACGWCIGRLLMTDGIGRFADLVRAANAACAAAALILTSGVAPGQAQTQPTLNPVASLSNAFNGAINPRNNKVYAYQDNGDVSTIDLATNVTELLYSTGTAPRYFQGIVLHPAKPKVYVASGKNLIEIDTSATPATAKTLTGVVGTSAVTISAL